MFAIVQITGHQYKVEKGDVLEVQKFAGKKAGDKVKVSDVLLRSDGSKTDIGTPFVSGAEVELKIVDQIKGEKLIVFKKKPKKRYEKKQGHRQEYSKVEVVNVK